MLPGNCNSLEASVSLWHCLGHSIPFSTNTQVITCILHIAACQGAQVLIINCLEYSAEMNLVQTHVFPTSKRLSVYLFPPSGIVTQQAFTLPAVCQPFVPQTFLPTYTWFNFCFQCHKQEGRVSALLLVMIWHLCQCTQPCWHKWHGYTRWAYIIRKFKFYYSTTWTRTDSSLWWV